MNAVLRLRQQLRGLLLLAAMKAATRQQYTRMRVYDWLAMRLKPRA